MLKVRFIIVSICMLTVFALAQTATKVQLKGKSGSLWILDKGAVHGVKAGMSGYFWKSIKSGDTEIPSRIGRFKVERVEERTCYVKVENISAGFMAVDFQWATFAHDILPAPIAAKTQKQTEVKREMPKEKKVPPEPIRQPETQPKTVVQQPEKKEYKLSEAELDRLIRRANGTRAWGWVITIPSGIWTTLGIVAIVITHVIDEEDIEDEMILPYLTFAGSAILTGVGMSMIITGTKRARYYYNKKVQPQVGFIFNPKRKTYGISISLVF